LSLKNPVTPPRIDPGTFRLVAQRLNHYATTGPNWYYVASKNQQLTNLRQLSQKHFEELERSGSNACQLMRYPGLYLRTPPPPKYNAGAVAAPMVFAEIKILIKCMNLLKHWFL
jgi:hypothetical protein